MNDDDLRTQLRRDLDATPTWPLDLDDAAARASRLHRGRMAMTAATVVIALGVTAASVYGLTTLGHSPRTHPGVPPPETSIPPAIKGPTTSIEVRLMCDGTTTRPTEFNVQAGRAGIEIVVVNTTPHTMEFADESGGADAPPGSHVIEFPQGGRFWPLAPGDHRVQCVPSSSQDPQKVSSAIVHVDDPQGYWVSDETQCTNDQGFGTSVDFAPGAGWETEAAAVHQALDHYAIPGDVIRQVGYPDEHDPEYALVRDGRTIVLTSLFQMQGKWLYDGAHGCSGEQRSKGGFHAPIRNA